MSYLRLEFNNDFIHQGVSTSMPRFLYAQWHFFKGEITAVLVWNFKAVLSVNMTKEKQF